MSQDKQSSSNSTTESLRLAADLAKTDAEIIRLQNHKNEIEEQRKIASSEIAKLLARSQAFKAQLDEHGAKQTVEENRLKDEQRRIVERRKQLSSIGGTKAAKLLEREIDIASRAVQTMEQRVIEMMQQVERIGGERSALDEQLNAKRSEFDSASAKHQELIAEFDEKISALKKGREAELSRMDEKVRQLYTRVNSRYPGSAVAEADGGSCMSCFRALPAQTFNQVIAGAVLQCPGCNRILVPIIKSEIGQS